MTFRMKFKPAPVAGDPKDLRAPRTSFGQAEKDYVPGAGRGAIGFTTRSDIGPAKQAVIPMDRSISAQKERARLLLLRKSGPLPSSATSGTGDRGEDLSESNYDAFHGYLGLSNHDRQEEVYDAEDHEADRIYGAIDARMGGRRKRLRSEMEKSESERKSAKRPHVSEMFKPEKRQLAQLSLSEWESIPEATDMTRRKQSSSRTEKFTPVPDSIAEGMASQSSSLGGVSGTTTSIPGGAATSIGTATSSPAGYLTDLTHLGTARKFQLGSSIDSMSDSVSGQTVVDPKGYLTNLSSFDILTGDGGTDVSDVRRFRKLLESVVKSDPKHAPGWIAAARLEERAGKIQAARSLIKQGCQVCRHSIDVWIEAARMHDLKESKAILAAAVKNNPKSVPLWLEACQKETKRERKKLVLQQALELIPKSFELWKALVDLQTSKKEARLLLSRAVECCPTEVRLWLALARLESYDNARKVINRAVKKCPFEPAIYIAGAKLEESHQRDNGKKNGTKEDLCLAIIRKALMVLSAHQIVIDRELWMNEGSKCAERFPRTCAAIVECVIETDIEDEDRRQRFLQDIELYKRQGRKNINLCRSIFDYMLDHDRGQFEKEWKIWWDYACFERDFTGDLIACEKVLKKACYQQCSQSVRIWLLFVKLKWTRQNDMIGARAILDDAFEKNPKSERLYLAASKIEMDGRDYPKARLLLGKARMDIKESPVIWMKSALLERVISVHGLCSADQSNADEKNDDDSNSKKDSVIAKDERMTAGMNELKLIDEGISKFGMAEPRLWLMKIHWAERRGKLSMVRETCALALKSEGTNPKYLPVWLEYARIEEQSARNIAKARSLLERARVLHPGTDILYLLASELELRAGNDAIAKSILAKGLQQCGSSKRSGLLLALSIRIEAFPVRKGKCVEAIRLVKDDPHVLCEVAKYTWHCHKMKHTREWFERAVKADADIGDAWALYLRFLRDTGAPISEQKSLIERCVKAEPRHGLYWTRVSKKVGNEHLSVAQILVAVATLIPVEV